MPRQVYLIKCGGCRVGEARGWGGGAMFNLPFTNRFLISLKGAKSTGTTNTHTHTHCIRPPAQTQQQRLPNVKVMMRLHCSHQTCAEGLQRAPTWFSEDLHGASMGSPKGPQKASRGPPWGLQRAGWILVQCPHWRRFSSFLFLKVWLKSPKWGLETCSGRRKTRLGLDFNYLRRDFRLAPTKPTWTE